MPTELPDSAKVLRNDVGKRMAVALEAIAEGSGGSAKIEEMTQAEYDQLTPAQKADGTLRAISDGQTKIQDIDNVNLTTSDNNKLLGVSVSGSDISVGAVSEAVVVNSTVKYVELSGTTTANGNLINPNAFDVSLGTPIMAFRTDSTNESAVTLYLSSTRDYYIPHVYSPTSGHNPIGSTSVTVIVFYITA